jgi:hypothetical protein
MQNAIYLCLILTIFEFSQQNFTEVRNTKFHRNASVWSLADTCGQTDKDIHMTSLGALSAHVPKNLERNLTYLKLWTQH